MTDTLQAADGSDLLPAGADENTNAAANSPQPEADAPAPADAKPAKPDKRTARARARAAAVHAADDGPSVAVVLKTSKLRDLDGGELVRGTVATCPERKADRLVASRKVRLATEREVASAGLLRRL